MQHLKVKSKVAYAFMAAIRMIPLMISSFNAASQIFKNALSDDRRSKL